MGEKNLKQNFDVIVVGGGMTGSWAAKEFCEAGLKTLVLERGRMVKHLDDYPTATMLPWELEHRGRVKEETLRENPIVSRCYAFDEATSQFFVKDKEHPYIQEKPFDWIRGYQVGGRSLIWGRSTQRWSNFEFEAPSRDGFAVDWPIRYKDLESWYSYVEKFMGISGNYDHIPHLPDCEFLPPFELNCVEKHIQSKVADNYTDRQVIIGRCAHISEPKNIHLEQGRGKCMVRNLCARGCPYGGYYSANSSTIPWAEKTGNMTLLPHSVTHSIIYDESKQKAIGVRVVDALNNESREYFSKVIFLNSGTLNSNLLLLNSISSRFPNGLGNDSGTLGHFIAFHNYRGAVSASIDGFEDKYYYGRRPTMAFIPAFRNVYHQQTDFLRGYLGYFSAGRSGWQRQMHDEGIGEELKKKVSEPGEWRIYMGMQGETIPKFENHVRLSKDKKDQWDVPQMIISVDYDDNDEKMVKDFITQGSEMLEKAGCKNISSWDSHQAPGLDIHEMGGVRMGKDTANSMLNKWNQLHSCKNVFVTDGACMVSTGNQNPSLTFIALTVRAAHHAIEELKKGNI